MGLRNSDFRIGTSDIALRVMAVEKNTGEHI